MKLLDDYFELKKQIHEYFGYKEKWVTIPLNDCTKFYWKLFGEGQGGSVYFGDTIEDIKKETGYLHNIYTQRFLPKWVYRGEEYTMIVVDTRTYENKFLAIFDNKKEIKD